MSKGYCIYIDTFCDGPEPIESYGNSNPIVYATECEAQRSIVDDVITRCQQFLDGERDFEDAVTIEEYVEEVDIKEDGKIVDRFNNRYKKV